MECREVQPHLVECPAQSRGANAHPGPHILMETDQDMKTVSDRQTHHGFKIIVIILARSGMLDRFPSGQEAQAFKPSDLQVHEMVLGVLGFNF